jgi:oxidase EvaA
MNINKKFLRSALSVHNCIHTLEEVRLWISNQNKNVFVEVNKTTFKELKDWAFVNNFEALKHVSNRFFSIIGIDVYTNFGTINQWNQPIINQPEIGYLGFITKEIEGVLYFLLQAKIEPGNVNYVQLSPTLQATKSNYSRVHKGKSPDYLDYFVNAKSSQIVLDQLQSEQGARFFRKRNRNIIIHIEEEIELKSNFIWLTLGQIKHLMQEDNLINMDTRTVISGIPFEKSDKFDIQNVFLQSYFAKKSLFTFDELIKFITDRKCQLELNVNIISLSQTNGWIIEDHQIRHEQHKYFKVIPASVTINNREVMNWSQPMIEPAQEGICAFVCKKINGVLHFIVQAKLEVGNFDIVELAPTVQCLTGNYRTEGGLDTLPFLKYVLETPKDRIFFDTLQSEEGGRFYKEQNRNMIVFADDFVTEELPENYIWMTLHQLQTFIKFNNYLNIQARSLIAAITLE